ncbi:MAG: ABC transporter ATP-binding protein [Candidatus Odinarchaeota archaeon]
MTVDSTITGEVMVGFLIDKLDQLGNRRLQEDLQKALKKKLHWKKTEPATGEFNTFMLANGQCKNIDFLESEARIDTEETIRSIHRNYINRTGKLLRSRTKRNRSEIESHRILARFLETIPGCPANPESMITQENQKMVNFIEKAISSIVERSWIIFWSFDQAGEDRIAAYDGTFQRQHAVKMSSPALHAFDELLILNFAKFYLKSLDQLLGDITRRVNEVQNSFEGSSETIEISDPDLAAEAFGILIGDLVGGIDALRTIVRQITRIEEIQSLAHEEIEFLNGFGEEIKARVSNGKNLTELRVKLEKNIGILHNLQNTIRNLEKESHQGKIRVNLEGFHTVIIELPIQLREVKIWADRFMDITFLIPESDGVALKSAKDAITHKHKEGIIVEAINLHKTYRPTASTVYALRGANISIKQGEFVAILGPSGSGKTTLINIMAGLEVPDRGKVYFEGRDISQMSDDELSDFRRNNIGFVFQQYILDPRLNVYENVALPALMAGKTENLKQRVYELLDSLGLENYANQNPMKLSGGELQRVIIARACVNTPLVVFADEPTGDLDSETGKQVLTNFQRFCNEKGITFIVVTHDQEMASFADRIVNMKDGRIIEYSNQNTG